MPFIYPTSFSFSEIQPDLMARGREGRIGLDIMPPVNDDAAKVRWAQKDNFFGLQALRGLDGAPTRVQRVGQKIYEYEPGVFGEYLDVTETELTIRSQNINVATQPVDVGDLVLDLDNQLIGRELDRMESSVWTLLTTGTINIIIDGPDGTQIGYSDTYTFQTFTALNKWGSLSTATPIANFQSVQQLGEAAGHSVDFGAAATTYMNTKTANLLLNNQNASDFGGRRSQYGATLNNLPALNSYWQGQNLPKIVTYDKGYIPRQGGKFKKFIPDNVFVTIGQRPNNVRIGEYKMTRNASNGFRPGSYRYVIDRASGGGSGNAEKRTPANIEVHRGHNGGPVIYYPTAVIVGSV